MFLPQLVAAALGFLALEASALPQHQELAPRVVGPPNDDICCAVFRSAGAQYPQLTSIVCQVLAPGPPPGPTTTTIDAPATTTTPPPDPCFPGNTNLWCIVPPPRTRLIIPRLGEVDAQQCPGFNLDAACACLM